MRSFEVLERWSEKIELKQEQELESPDQMCTSAGKRGSDWLWEFELTWMGCGCG